MGGSLEIKERKILDYMSTGAKLTNFEATLWFGYTDLRSFRCRYNKNENIAAKIASDKVDNKKHHVYYLVSPVS